MKISPLIILLGLGLIVLPETIITIPLFPFGRTEAALVPINNDTYYTETETETSSHNNQSSATTDASTTTTTTQPIERILFGESRTMRVERRSSRRRGAEPPRTPLECAACEYLAKGVNQTILHNPKVIAFVTADIEKVCSVLPESVQAMCNDAAQSVAPMLLNHLGDFIVTEGCEDLGVCH